MSERILVPRRSGGFHDWLDLREQATAPPIPRRDGRSFLYFKTDGKLYKMVDGTETEVGAGGGNLAGTELDYAQFTAPVTVSATAEATPTDIVVGNPVTYDGSTVVLIHFWAPRANDAGTGDFLQLFLYDGTTSLGEIFQMELLAATIFDQPQGFRRLTPSAASHTYKVGGIRGSANATVTAGAGGAGNVVPGFLRITRVSS